MNYIAFASKIATNNNCIKFLRQKGLLKPAHWCGDCNIWKSQINDESRKDKYWFRCSRCRKKTSIRDGSFFSKSHLSLTVLVSVIYFFVLDIPVKTILDLLDHDLSKKAVIDWYNFCRDICTEFLQRNPPLLGGLGVVVEIDESKFSRKAK